MAHLLDCGSRQPVHNKRRPLANSASLSEHPDHRRLKRGAQSPRSTVHLVEQLRVRGRTRVRHSFHLLLHRGLELIEGELPVAVRVGGHHHQLDGPVVGIVPMLPQCRLQLGSIDAAALVLVDLGEERLQAFVVELASECDAGLRGADGSITGASINTEERARSVFGDGDSLPATTGRRQQHPRLQRQRPSSCP